MKNTKLLCSLVLCYSGLLVGAAAPQAATMEEMQEAMPVLSPFLRMRDIGRLSQVSHGIHQAVEPTIVTAMEQGAKWESRVLDARALDLTAQRQNRDNRAFKDYVIQRIKEFTLNNPGTWINLNLSSNSLGNDLAFLRDLLQAIVTTVHNWETDLASLNLDLNQLSSLPERPFEGLTNLQKLYLSSNQLENLAESVFEGLNNLQDLSLYNNQLKHLPGRLFEGLYNLQKLSLSSNQLESVPERLFEGLNSLQDLSLYSNQLTALPERLFKGLHSLQRLYLSHNAFEDFPEALFEGLNNLQMLYLSYNRLSSLPERLFEGLANLQMLYLEINELVLLPKHLFDSLNNLQQLDLRGNQLNKESIRLLQILRKRGVRKIGFKVRW